MKTCPEAVGIRGRPCRLAGWIDQVAVSMAGREEAVLHRCCLPTVMSLVAWNAVPEKCRLEADGSLLKE